jgi:hypothetical protein
VLFDRIFNAIKSLQGSKMRRKACGNTALYTKYREWSWLRRKNPVLPCSVSATKKHGKPTHLGRASDAMVRA